MNLEDLKLKLKFLEDGDRVYKLDTKINNFYIIKDNGWYGVGIDINLDKTEYFEKFENVRLITKIKYFLNENHKLLELITNKVDLIEEFSLVCFDFINKFHQATFDKGQTMDITSYLEANTSDDSTYANVNINSNYNLITWGKLNPEIISFFLSLFAPAPFTQRKPLSLRSKLIICA